MEGFISFVKKFALGSDIRIYGKLYFKKKPCNKDDSFGIRIVKEKNIDYYTLSIIYDKILVYSSIPFRGKNYPWLMDYINENEISNKQLYLNFKSPVHVLDVNMYAFYPKVKSARK